MRRPARAILLLATILLPPAAFGHGDIHQQIADLTARLEADPDNGTLYYKRGRLHLEHEGWEKARADLEKARALDATLEEVEYHVARALYGAGRFADADRVLAAHLEAVAAEAEQRDVGGALMRGHMLHGRVLVALGRQGDAAASYERSVAAAKEPLPDQYMEWANALADDDPKAAVGVLDQGLEALGPLITLQLRAVELNVAAGNVAGAVQRLDQLIAATPQPVALLHRRGKLLRDAGCPGEARSSFEEALAVLEAVPEHRRRTRALAEVEVLVRSDLTALPDVSAPCADF